MKPRALGMPTRPWLADRLQHQPHSGRGNLTPVAYANAPNMGAALNRGLRAPFRCIARPTALKTTLDSTRRWMKDGAQVNLLIRAIAYRSKKFATGGLQGEAPD
jgi:hypothetical protein